MPSPEFPALSIPVNTQRDVLILKKACAPWTLPYRPACALACAGNMSLSPKPDQKEDRASLAPINVDISI